MPPALLALSFSLVHECVCLIFPCTYARKVMEDKRTGTTVKGLKEEDIYSPGEV